jgi:AcrR family transcriptional regulator
LKERSRILTLPFNNLDPDKQERILNAAMKEFARKGYDDASTNEIVKAANIGKGRLFHYFNTKKDLFLFLFDTAMNTLKTDYLDLIDKNERDIFIRLHQATLLKIEVYRKLPWLFDFAKASLFTTSDQVREEIETKRKNMISLGFELLYSDIDLSKFKEEIDPKKAVDLITWSIEGYGYRMMDKIKNLSDLSELDWDGTVKEFDEYLKILKQCFYK